MFVAWLQLGWEVERPHLEVRMSISWLESFTYCAHAWLQRAVTEIQCNQGRAILFDTTVFDLGREILIVVKSG